MAQIISTNLASLNAQRNLTNSQSTLATSLQRLSSGLRINSAKDDAAGLAISERMTSQIRGLNQAGRNANDAISLAQTSEGNLAEIGNVLQRIREIAVQAANDTNTTADRSSLNSEVTALSAEIDRIAGSAQFNGKNLLDGSFGTASFQVGANAGQTISMTIDSAKNSAIGNSAGATLAGTATGTAAHTYTSGTMLLNGVTVAAAVTDGVSYVAGSLSGATSALSSVNAINLVSATSGVVASATTTVTSGTVSTLVALVDGDIKINGTSLGAFGTAANATARVTAIVDAANAITSTTGVTAVSLGTTYKLTTTDGRNIDLSSTLTSAGATGASTGADMLTGAGFTISTGVPITNYGQITLLSGKALVVSGAVIAGSGITSTAIGTGTADVSTQTKAALAVLSMDVAIDKVNNQRAALGTTQTRFQSVIANLQTSSENLSAARSRIRDTDFAAETASLTRNQILQQAGMAMLAQANSLPSSVLALLK